MVSFPMDYTTDKLIQSHFGNSQAVWCKQKKYGILPKEEELVELLAALFWQNTMYADADVVLTPRPLHMEDRMIMWCYCRPPGLYEKISYEIGKFDLSTYWGPFASNKSSAWIGRATELVLEEQKPNILFTYIPHLDYIFQREGIFPKNLKEEVRFVDEHRW